MPTVPLYQRIVDDIAHQIETGVLRPGDRLPTNKKLTEIYNVSTTVVRNAMMTLRNLGLVEGQQGRGVYVRRS